MRDSSEATNWLPVTSPTANGPKPSLSCRCSGRTGSARPMSRKPAKIAAMIGTNLAIVQLSSAAVPVATIAGA
ncbi:hypothetical protein P3C33_20135 [Mesorhizobium sp. P16.1]|uniref:hypothetical protein n=1 Tax=unclassified Mesorhizobium TaxID=325217 RepID=UPI001FE0A084|nr:MULTISPECIES: hypothetical protein [unclassified Mesorhizobium]MDF3168484.1 hypothetical protein [Mesorhizobium sp. P16.1]